MIFDVADPGIKPDALGHGLVGVELDRSVARCNGDTLGRFQHPASQAQTLCIWGNRDVVQEHTAPLRDEDEDRFEHAVMFDHVRQLPFNQGAVVVEHRTRVSPYEGHVADVCGLHDSLDGSKVIAGGRPKHLGRSKICRTARPDVKRHLNCRGALPIARN
jgi:hypothetical protein